MNENLFKQSLEYFKKENYIKGINLLEQYIKNKNTNNGHAFNNLGAAYMLIGNYEEAKNNFDKAIKEKDFPSKIYFNLAELNLRLGNDSLSYKNEYKALQYYKIALNYLNAYLEIDKTNEYCLLLKKQLTEQLSNMKEITI